MDALTRRIAPPHAEQGPHPVKSRTQAPLRWLRWIALAVALTFATPALAQQKPVMENVFYNVVWGSATGALLGAAASVIGAKDKTNPTGVRTGVFQGATAGGLIGLGVGVWLVFAGINFEPQTSTITDGTQLPSLLEGRQLALTPLPTPLITLETSPTHPSHITGFRALVVDLKF
jgi:hypothetical protein